MTIFTRNALVSRLTNYRVFRFCWRGIALYSLCRFDQGRKIGRILTLLTSWFILSRSRNWRLLLGLPLEFRVCFAKELASSDILEGLLVSVLVFSGAEVWWFGIVCRGLGCDLLKNPKIFSTVLYGLSMTDPVVTTAGTAVWLPDVVEFCNPVVVFAVMPCCSRLEFPCMICYCKCGWLLDLFFHGGPSNSLKVQCRALI